MPRPPRCSVTNRLHYLYHCLFVHKLRCYLITTPFYLASIVWLKPKIISVAFRLKLNKLVKYVLVMCCSWATVNVLVFALSIQ